MSNPGEVLHGFLCAWLGFHILGEDQEMARQIALIRAGESADKAFDIAPKPLDNSTTVLLAALGSLYRVLSEQNRDLAAANRRLEERVAERTTKLAQANQKLTEFNLLLEARSNTDSLLGIANRRYFDERLAVEWRRAVRAQQAVSLLMIDVDYFKHYNDAYGHQAGDHCLQSVAQAALSAIRRPPDLLARYGGEELVALLPITDLNGATSVAQNIRKAVSDLHIQHADSPVAGEVTVSIGVASMMPDRATGSSALIAAADDALYAAKEGGRNRVCTG
jgi:hemerythrin